MKRVLQAATFGLIALLATASAAFAASECATCHQEKNPGMYMQWKNSKHGQNDVVCIDCHQADKKDVDAFEHHGATIATLVTPKDCSKCLSCPCCRWKPCSNNGL